jgi:hypothetical protein
MWQLRTHEVPESFAPETDLVVQFQAVPVRLELLQTVLAHLADTTEKRVKQQESRSELV